MTQATLMDFEGQPGPGIAQDKLPDRDFPWQDEPTTIAGLEVIQPDVTHRGNPGVVKLGGDCILRANEFGYVVGGLEEYLDEHRDEAIDIPAYYSRFDEEADVYLGGVTASNGSFGVGATPRRLESAVRAATGGGAFSSSETEVIGCGEHPFVVRNSQGAFVFSTVDLDRPNDFDLEDYPRHEVAGLSVPEDIQEVRDGIVFFKRALASEFDIELVSHETLADGYHYFENADGQQVRIKGNYLKRLSGTVRDPDQVRGEMAYEDPWGEQFSAVVDDVDFDLGTPMRRRGNPVDQRPKTDRVVGFARSWFDPRRSSRVSLSSRVKAQILYVRLQLSIDKSGTITVERETHTESIKEVRPENEEMMAVTKGV